MHQMLGEDASRPRGDDYVNKNQNRKLIPVTSSNARLKLLSVTIPVTILTITDIWTKFDIELEHHTTNTPEWPNSHNLKIQDGGGRHLKFRRNVNDSELDTAICTNLVSRCITATWRWPRDQKSKPEVNSVTSSNECREHVDIRAYKSSQLTDL